MADGAETPCSTALSGQSLLLGSLVDFLNVVVEVGNCVRLDEGNLDHELAQGIGKHFTEKLGRRRKAEHCSCFQFLLTSALALISAIVASSNSPA